tara:strand:- start:31876 stop:32631 length:756 start_codon:yes stop_codon:yes gene_type:complete
MELTLEKIDSYELKTFIKKLLPIDKFIFMKINNSNTTSSVYFPERDAVKLVNVETPDMFDGSISDPVKVSFYNGSKVIDALSHFNGSTVTGVIKYEQIGGELMASDFTLRNDNLEINLACADPSLSFMEMSEDETRRAFGTDDNMFSFELLTPHIEKMKSLFSLEKEDDLFTLEITDKGVNVKGESYNASLCQSREGGQVGDKVVIYKKYINLLDKESYKVTVCQNKVVFHSLDTETSLTVAVAVIEDETD